MKSKRSQLRRSSARAESARAEFGPRVSAVKIKVESGVGDPSGTSGAPVSARTAGEVRAICRVLKRSYPEAECALVHRNPLELLIATILSAQCTDVRVNQVTPKLFGRYPDASSLAAAPLGALERLVQSTGFFRNKAKNIKACCTQLRDHYGGVPPRDMEALVGLPGVGRKTANVLLGTAYGIASGVVVDTHVGRISRRLGLTQATDAVRAERDLMEVLPQREWIAFSHRLIHHGRQVCKARKPACAGCELLALCPQIGVGA